MNPCQKYKAKKRKPFKLAIQIFKIALVTMQVQDSLPDCFIQKFLSFKKYVFCMLKGLQPAILYTL